MATMNVTIEGGMGFLPDGSVVNLLAIQQTLNNAFQETGDMEFAHAANELSRITQKYQGPHGEFLDGSYYDSCDAPAEPVAAAAPLDISPLEAIESRKVLVLSAHHLSKDTCLCYKEWPFIADFEEGCYFYVGDEPELYTDAPEDLKAVLAFAKRHGCVEVKFDRDGDYIAELPRFNW